MTKENKFRRRKISLSLIAFIILTHTQAAFGLKCLVGLGNTSEMKKLKVVDCPEGKFYVCVKMYGGGMGDQIRRYCESIPREDYNDLLEKEDRKASDEHFDHDPACYETVHNGRDVHVCICSGDKCNSASAVSPFKTFTILALVILIYRTIDF